ncbi:GNAT family N-acetyltransferase [Corticicoccus populi]|uniref:GNAT family N-acetyltransferase n=1 Tax=Corticicoccus populi TaxID=1812821 RepID=A0ABW5WV31_9STAP
MKKINISKSREENNEFSNFLKTQIRSFNDYHSIHHKQSRDKKSIAYLSYIVKDSQEHWLGGLAGAVYWNWFEIEDFWLNENIRGQGLGKRILQNAEKDAKEIGATKVLLTTFDFQGKLFYEAHHYKIVGEVSDYPPGKSYYTMVKHL